MYRSYLAHDSLISFGTLALTSFNKNCSPSAKLKEKTMYVRDGLQLIEKVDDLNIVLYEDRDDWYAYHVVEKYDLIQDGIIHSVMVDFDTGDRDPLVYTDLNDFQKTIKIKYIFTKVDGSFVWKTITIPKKSLVTFKETLLLTSKTTESFKLFISKESLKEKYKE